MPRHVCRAVIKSGGEWISSIEIENIAVGHPQVGWLFGLPLLTSVG